MTFCSISDIHILAFTTCVSLRQIDAPFCGEFISPPDSRRGVIMGEAALKAMVIIALGMVAGAGLAGGLAGAVVGKVAGVPVVITAPIGAALGAAATGTATYRRIWYGGKRDNNPPADDQ